MKRILFIGLAFMILPFTIKAQDVKGIVCLAGDKSPAQFAGVGLLQLPDSSAVTGVITLTDGGYLFEKVKPGDYVVKVSFVGYSADVKKVKVGTEQNQIVVDTIFLAENATNLSEVTVVGERLKGKELVDRTIYSVPSAAAKASTTGYDLLRKIPQVNVDFQNNITLNGSSNFIIQVDGKQRDREYLAKLMPSDIESIEVISNPSGKYEGNIDGVLNIILKKEARYGMSGNASLTAKPFNKLTSSASGSLDYSAGNITFYVTGFSFLQNLSINNRMDSRFLGTDSITSLNGNGDISVTNSSINGGFDYYMNKKNNLSFNINYKPITQNIDMLSNTILKKGNTPLNTIGATTNQDLGSNESSVSLFYKRTFEKPVQEFTVESNYYWFRSNELTDFSNNRYAYGSDVIQSSYSRIEDTQNKRDYFSTKVDYVQPLGMNARLELGYQFYYQDLGYDYNIDNSENDNLFVYKELRNSVYTGLTYNVKKLGLQALVRVENSQINADSVTDPNYFCVLPSVNLQYKFSASHNLKFTYNRRINRPGIYDMNPYDKIDQNYNISTGNPDLKPDYRDRLQLTYTWNFGSNYFSPYVYREYFTGRVGRLFQLINNPVTGTLTTLTKPENVIDGYESGGGVNAMLWYVNISSRFYKGHFNEYRQGAVVIPEVDYSTYNITATAFYQLGKKKSTTLFSFLQYNGVNVNSQSKTYSIPLYGFGGQHQIKNHTLGVFWLLPFSTDVRLNRTETSTQYYSSTNIIGFDVANFIQFSYTYKFNKGKDVKKLNRKIELESDSKSQAIGK
ncbi:MAG: outer membrane beta-barrel protein [Bacteroidales bacterium]